ncbi:MAG: rhodanese-like domain-containing protein [Myxococcota bacterium]
MRRLLLVLLALTACAGTTTEPTTPASTTANAEPPVTAGSIDISAFKVKYDQDPKPVLIDVRSAAEYKAGHIDGAQLVPLPTLPGRLDELSAMKGAEIYVVCQAGGRSKRAAAILAKNGFNAINVEGGTGGWIAAGHPVVTD